MILTIFITITAALTAFYFWQESTHKFKCGNRIPGPSYTPLLGNALDIILCTSPHEIMKRALQLGEPYKKIAKCWLGSKLIVAISEPDDVEIILNNHLMKADDYKFFQPWLGNGLLISHGDKWRAHRKMIAPTFHLNILKSFMNVFNKKSRQVVEKMRLELGKTFDVHDHMSATTVEILLETAMGITEKDHDHAGLDYAKAVMKMCEMIHLRQMRFFYRSDLIFNWSKMGKIHTKCLDIIHGLTRKVLSERKNDFIQNKTNENSESLLEKVTKEVEEIERQEQIQNELSPAAFKGIKDDLDEDNDVGQKKRLAFLDFMIEASQTEKDLTDTDIKEEVDTIMFEGHDTTAAGSSFVLCMLGVHQNIQTKVMDELNDIFGDSDRNCTFNDTLQMKYLERVILETLRLYPPVPVIARQVTEDVQLVTDNLIIPAGTTVIVSQFIIHRREHLFPNPLVFDPDNFLPEKCQKRHYYSYIPFAAGPRSCVGRKYALLKLKVILSTILRNFKVLSDCSEADFKLQADIILKRADGFQIRLENRK